MIRRILFITLAFLGHQLFAADTLEVTSTISHVTVFLHGAEVQRSAELNVPAGKTFMRFSNLPYELNPNSIQAKSGTNFEILLVKHFSEDNQSFRKSPAMKAIEANQKKIQLQMELNRQKIDVYKIEEKVIYDNRAINNENGVKPADLKASADFYRSRLVEIREGVLKLLTENDELQQQYQELNHELNKASNQINKVSSTVLVAIESKTGGKIKLNLSYFINSAGWSPLYDFRYKSINDPLTLVYQANVFQSSGENWDNVMLTLSNNKPAVQASNPVLNRWYLDRAPAQTFQNTTGGSGAIKGVVTDSDGNEPIPFANFIVKRGNQVISGASTDFSGNFFVKPLDPGYYEYQVSFVGYEPLSGNISVTANQISFLNLKIKGGNDLAAVEIKSPSSLIARDDIRKMPGRSSESVAPTVGGVSGSGMGGGVSIRGSRGDDGSFGYIDGVKVYDGYATGTKSKNVMAGSINMNEINAVPLSVDYDIKVPYTINSDGVDNNIRIKSIEVPANYIHYAVPKMDPATFLTAELVKWQQLNLLSGTANLYYEGTFIGESELDVENTKDTLVLSLGRDPQVVVERTSVKEQYEKKVLGNNIKETYAWEIAVRNNKGSDITIEIRDQYPLAVLKSIETELIETSGAKVDSEDGSVVWKTPVKAGERKTFNLKYTVKYPQNINIYK